MKAVFSIFISLFLCLVGVDQAICGDSADQMAEKMLLRQRAIYEHKLDVQDKPEIGELLDALQNKAARDLKTATWYSHNPADVQPLLSRTWRFTYRIFIPFTDTLSFASTVSRTSNGTVGVMCNNQWSTPGAVFYSSWPSSIGGGRGFSGIVGRSSAWYDYYFFRLVGSGATGWYCFSMGS